MMNLLLVKFIILVILINWVFLQNKKRRKNNDNDSGYY